jgi:hypothetical protein
MGERWGYGAGVILTRRRGGTEEDAESAGEKVKGRESAEEAEGSAGVWRA